MMRCLVILVVLWLTAAGNAATSIAWRARNIDWAAVEETTNEVSRTKLIVRTLRLADGHRLRVRERLERNASGGEDRVYVDGEKLDELSIVATDGTIENVLAVLREKDCPVIRRYGRTGTIVRARLGERNDAERAAICAELESCGAKGTVKATTSPLHHYQTLTPAPAPNDPLLPSQWHLGSIGATNVWQQECYGFPDIACAVFDTGVHLTHEDLRVNVKTRVSALKSDPDNPEDHHGHGSHCLGIMGADGNNGKGVTGVGQVANMTSIRGPISYGTAEDSILDGYQYALEHDIRVLSCSFGTSPGVPGDLATCALLEELKKNGCLVVIAAGNDGNDNDRVPTYPASYTNDNIIAVIASTPKDAPVTTDVAGWGTSYGATSCDIAAPGVDIVSCTRESDSAYEAWGGTSMATPIVAACAAMVWQQHPDWPWQDVRDRIFSTATPVRGLIGYCATGARVNLEAALNQPFTLAVEPLAKKAYEVGEEMEIRVRVPDGEFDADLVLMNRDNPEIAYSIETKHLTPGDNAFTYRPIPEDIGRGWLFKVEGKDVAAEAKGYSSVFRVKEAGKVETIAVTKPAEGQKLDAAAIGITFAASDALYADLALEHFTTNGTWEMETTLGLVSCTNGQSRSVTVELRGPAWISDLPYRIVVSDNDDPGISGTSAEFMIDRSSLTVGLEVEGLDPEALNSWEVGVERRVQCHLPMTDLYWLLLIDAETEQAVVLKETWYDRADPRAQNKDHAFGLTIPESVDPTHSRTFYLKLVDAFDMSMYCDSPVFTLAPRSDGLTEPSLEETLGCGTNHVFQGNGQWYPSCAASPTAEGGPSWKLKCGYVGKGESAWFETDVVGPITVHYDVEKNDFPGTFVLQRAKTPIMKATTWYDVPDGRIPEGAWHLRWTFARDRDSVDPTGKTLDLAVSNMRFLLTMPDVAIKVKSDSIGDYLRITGGAYPTNVYYTLDGSLPTRDSPLWVDGMNTDPYRFRLDRSMRIRAYADMEGAEPGLVASKDYFFQKGAGTAEDPIRLEDPLDVATFASWVLADHDCKGLYVSMTNDIDMSDFPTHSIGIWTGPAEQEVNHPFLGTFDAHGHILANVTITDTIDHFGPKKFLFCDVGKGTVLRNLTLANANGGLMFIDEEIGTEAVIENCTETPTVPSGFDPPPFTPPDYRAYGKPTAITPFLFCDATPLHDGDTITLINRYSVVTDRTSQYKQPGPWIVRYTTDGTEPTEASPVLPSALPLLRSFTLKARIFAPPYYEPGETVTVTFEAEFLSEASIFFLR